MVMFSDCFWLWVDGVGGYLVCPGETVTIGQPAIDGSTDVPILADLSRRHAEISRQGENYLLHALREARVDGRPVGGSAVLRAESLIELGEAVRLRFRRPHPLSLSARLDLASRHRTQPGCDGIILAHETIVLGPRGDGHVVCPGWPHEIVLSRQVNGWSGSGQWHCRAGGRELEVDGVRASRRASLASHSRIVGPGIAISLEPASKIGPSKAK